MPFVTSQKPDSQGASSKVEEQETEEKDGVQLTGWRRRVFIIKKSSSSSVALLTAVNTENTLDVTTSATIKRSGELIKCHFS